ncbi:MAG: SDR family oxidoreductase [Actinomycetota bacterium]|nr:SDR family oxidoreductase [Actinomycetota bacterium]
MSDAPAGLTGRVVVVTGGTQGLGAETARLAAIRGAAGVAIVGRDPDRGAAVVAELQAAGTDALFVAAELGAPDAADHVMAAVDQRFGVVHGLVNSAAATDRGGIWDTTASLFDRMLAVNVRAPLLLTQAAARIMRREGVDGSIVNIGSVSGYGGDVFLLPYAVSKGALHALTRNVAFALMRDRIRVNLLNLGWMDTPAEDVTQRTWHGAGDDWLERAAERQPLGRLIDTTEAARTICFLLSSESGLMTGAVVDFDQSVLGSGSLSKPTAADVWPPTAEVER